MQGTDFNSNRFTIKWQRKADVREGDAVAVKGYDILINQINGLLQTDRIMVASLSSVLAVQKRRIFQRGQDANLGKIGSYSRKPISISRKRQARQTGKTYFKGGYAEYHSLIGKGSPSTVNLRATDQMMMDYGVQVIGKKQYGLGFTNDFNFKKSDWNEEHFNKEIFGESSEDSMTFDTAFQFELNRIE